MNSRITILFIGFICGYFLRMYQSHQNKEVINQQVNNTQSSSIIQNEVQNSQDIDSSYTEKFFNKKGILVHEIVKKQENRASDLSYTNHTNLNSINSKITSATFSSIEERQESNYLIGFSIPFKIHPEFSDIDFQMGYRVLGPIYIDIQSDYKFSKPTVGILVNF